MCGRMNISDNEGIRLLMELVGMPSWPSIQARYNVAPTAMLDTLIREADNHTSLTHANMHWGLIPVWAKPGQFKSPLINARAETVWEKPSFKNLIKRQRVCIPINGFYEWQRSKNEKIPYFIYPEKSSAMLLAGIYQKSKDARYEVSVLTTQANASMAAIHHRMPVILDVEAANEWLLNDDVNALNTLMQKPEDNQLKLRQVSSFVNNARNEGPECIEAAS